MWYLASIAPIKPTNNNGTFVPTRKSPPSDAQTSLIPDHDGFDQIFESTKSDPSSKIQPEISNKPAKNNNPFFDLEDEENENSRSFI